MELADFAPKLNLLRARIEAGLERPVVLAVTSARRDDGKSLVSYGLSCSLAEADYKVLFVDASQYGHHVTENSAPKISDHPEFDVRTYVAPGKEGAPDTLGLSGPGITASGSVDAVRATFERFRETYEYTVIDMSVLTTSSLALLFAAVADGVIVTVREARSISNADKEVSNLLRTAGANFIGAVTADSSAIRGFRAAMKRHGAFSKMQFPQEDARKSGARVSVQS
ncbi:MAG: hypothetical protein GIX03_01365 [Candidatus Eremiobacteraeota bacterium]|nr:hypothetical protein [Candidatus Eremiobacteraeota bacterium]MBC5801668.1 hypothetical protein [Candidatus Eremiobacteraeota bacterium]MBC5824050.1 hypothetical protein [Candidatus Eremiobacteraeota bacterium]